MHRDGKYIARFVCYVDANTVRERLDSVVPGEWDLTLELLPALPGADDEPAAASFKARLQILGVIRGMTVTLQASSRVEGDIHHLSLAIEQGAEFDGRCRRPSHANELNLNLELGSSGAPKPN